MQTIEIYWRLVRYKLNSNKLFFWNELKFQVLKALRKWVFSWLLHNKKMYVIWEWKTNILVDKK